MKYRKKQVVIEAYQLPPNDGATRLLPPPWLVSAMLSKTVTVYPEGYAAIDTLEGRMRADVGDWIIKGVKDELYPCKPDIFAATYEPA
jgi:hypothetical protein